MGNEEGVISVRIRVDGHTYDVFLVDDGTMNTVVRVEHREYRYDAEYAAQFRKKNGDFSLRGFRELAKDAIEAFIQEDVENEMERG